jgi:hypothetical protein
MMTKRKSFRSIFLIASLAFSLLVLTRAAAQTVWEMPEPETPVIIPEPFPTQFRELALGMNLDDLKSALARDSLFHFRGDRDVSFMPARQETLVETTGSSFIRRAHFQLAQETLFIMAFTLDTRRMDHHTIFTTFTNRYGEPVTLNPQEAVWENDEVRVSIERPLTIKYIDKAIFDRLREEARTTAAGETILRERFLAEF